MSFVVIEDEFKQPFSFGKIRLDEVRCSVAVLDSLYVTVGRATPITAICFACGRWIDLTRILRHVFEDDCVTFVIASLANQPGEYSLRIVRIGDAAFHRRTIRCGDV